MKTIIHIGQHKTGTTSIQHYLRNRRIELAEEGLYVPDSLVGYNRPSHFILNVYALNQNRFSSAKENLLSKETPEYFAKLGQKLDEGIAQHYISAKDRGCKDIVWSNEGLYLLNSVEEYTRLRKLFDSYSSSVVCVVCFREPHSYRLSYTKQLTKRGRSLSKDRDSYRYLEYDSWLLDYKRKKELLNQVFDEVIIIPYDPVDMVKTFMTRISYSTSGSDSFRRNVTEEEPLKSE